MSYSSYTTGTSYNSDRSTPRAIEAPSHRRASMSVDGQALGRSFIYSSYRPNGLDRFAPATPAVHSTSSVHEETANFAGVGVDDDDTSSGSELGAKKSSMDGLLSDSTHSGMIAGTSVVIPDLSDSYRSYSSTDEHRSSSVGSYLASRPGTFSPAAPDIEAQGVENGQKTDQWEGIGPLVRKILTEVKSLPPWRVTGRRIVGYLPAVFLGALMNILDALSYGMIMFQLSESCFKEMGPVGLSMFYVSTIISQLVYSLGGSAFKSGIGSEMIEVTPFFHQMATAIMNSLGEEDKDAVLATTIVTLAFSSIVTGICFGLLGKFKLGKLVGFFPRHILVGCVGGVGYFLIVTAIEVCSRIEGGIKYNLEVLQYLFDPLVFLQWSTPLVLCILLVLAERVIHSPLLVPGYIIAVFVAFHLLVLVVPQWSLGLARQFGWVFPAQASSSSPWYSFYGLYKWGKVNWWLVFSQIPTILALTFFGVLHVPINVPALALSTGEGTEAIDVDRELLAHGVSNTLSGMFGSIQNYLVYTNSVLFIKAGADSRLSGVMLAIATAGVMVAGPGVIGFIPVCVVGTLVYLLGYELLKEALWDTVGRVRPFEYTTIVVIVVTMGAVDFVVGIIVGILLACVSFVVEAGSREVVSGVYSGEYVRSIVVRHPKQIEFLERVGRQTCVFKLTGSLFFGSIGGLEEKVRSRFAQQAWQKEPIKFLILDVNGVPGIDFSAAEGFKRIRNLVVDKGCYMLISSVDSKSVIVRALEDCGLWEDEEYNERVQLFHDLNSALEWCENRFLADVAELAKTNSIAISSRRASRLDSKTSTSSFKQSSSGIQSASVQSSSHQRRLPMALLENAGYSPSEHISLLSASPRHAQFVSAAQKSLSSERRELLKSVAPPAQPLPLILKTMQGLADSLNESFWSALCPYLHQVVFNPSKTIYARGRDSVAVFFVEHGLINYKMTFNNLNLTLRSSVLPLTLFGDMISTNSDRKIVYTASAVSTLWVLDSVSIDRLHKENPALYEQLLIVCIRVSAQRADAIASNILVSS